MRQKSDAREIRLFMADNMEASGRACIANGAVERGEQLLSMAREYRASVYFIDADGYDLPRQGDLFASHQSAVHEFDAVFGPPEAWE